MKKITISLVLFVALFAYYGTTVYAADATEKLPTRYTYAKEWINKNIFTLRSDSKVKLLDRYATARVNNIVAARNAGKSDRITEFSNRYQNLKNNGNKIIEKKKIKTQTLELVQQNTMEQQKLLSKVRQELDSEDNKKDIASIQEQVANGTRAALSKTLGEEDLNEFNDDMVTVWRDPENIIVDEKETRVYAAGTTAEGSIDDGVIVDGGEAKITKDKSNNLKIEYAPGTGPSSVVSDDGKKVWKIQMSDGTVVESYTSGNVVVGKSTGTASNIVINTVSGGTSTTAHTVVGSGSGSAGVVVVGGKSVVTSQAGQGSDGPTSSSAQTTTNSVNTVQGTNAVNQINGN